MSEKLQAAIAHLLEWIGEGRRVSEADSQRQKLIKTAIKLGYVERTRIRNDFIVSPTGRVP